MENLKKVKIISIMFFYIFFSLSLLVGCSKTESKKEVQVQKLEMGETATYKTDDERNVVDIEFESPKEISTEEGEKAGLNAYYSRYILLTCKVKCRTGEFDPRELTEKNITVTDSKDDIKRGVTLDKSEIPDEISEGQTIEINYVYGLKEKKSTLSVETMDFKWTGAVEYRPSSYDIYGDDDD